VLLLQQHLRGVLEFLMLKQPLDKFIARIFLQPGRRIGIARQERL